MRSLTIFFFRRSFSEILGLHCGLIPIDLIDVTLNSQARSSDRTAMGILENKCHPVVGPGPCSTANATSGACREQGFAVAMALVPLVLNGMLLGVLFGPAGSYLEDAVLFLGDNLNGK